KGAAADEQDVGGIDLNILLLGVLAAPLGRDIADGSFKHFEERLLHAFAGDIASDRDVLGGFGDFVDFIDVDDAALGRLDVKIRGVQELEEQVFDVFADIARLGEGGGVADGEGDV